MIFNFTNIVNSFNTICSNITFCQKSKVSCKQPEQKKPCQKFDSRDEDVKFDCGCKKQEQVVEKKCCKKQEPVKEEKGCCCKKQEPVVEKKCCKKQEPVKEEKGCCCKKQEQVVEKKCCKKQEPVKEEKGCCCKKQEPVEPKGCGCKSGKFDNSFLGNMLNKMYNNNDSQLGQSIIKDFGTKMGVYSTKKCR